jgi:recombination protein RecA
MSSAVVSTSAAPGRPFVFDGQGDDEAEPEVGLSSRASRVALDRTAEGGCPPTSPPPLNLRGVQESALALVQSALKNQTSKISPASVISASRLEIRSMPEMVSSGIPAIDALTGGLPRGCLTEVCGPASSGRTTLLLAALAAATRRGEFCVIVDASATLDPQSAAAAGVELGQLLWVRCGDAAPGNNSSPRSRPSTSLRACPEPAEGEDSATEKRQNQKDENRKDGYPISRAPLAREVGISARRKGTPSPPVFDFEPTESGGPSSKKNVGKENGSRESEPRLEQGLRATDLLLESGGFGLIVLDLGDLPPQSARCIPLTTWFRFRRAIEHTPTILLVIEQQAIAGSCSSLLLQLGGATDESAVERRKLTACGVNRGLIAEDEQAPKGPKKINPTQPENPVHAQLFTGLNITAELVRSRLDRKPARSIAFATKTAWAGGTVLSGQYPVARKNASGY